MACQFKLIGKSRQVSTMTKFITAPLALVFSLLSSDLLANSNSSSFESSSSQVLELDVIEWRFDAGVSLISKRLLEDLQGDMPSYGGGEGGYNLGLSAHKQVKFGDATYQKFIGTKLDIQRVDDHLLTSVRAVDFRQQVAEKWFVNAFIGAARYEFRSPAYGYLAGFGAYFKPPEWQQIGFAIEAQYYDKLARDKIHPDDPPQVGSASDSFFDMRVISATVNFYF
jgi:hypothetical protein